MDALVLGLFFTVVIMLLCFIGIAIQFIDLANFILIIAGIFLLGALFIQITKPLTGDNQ